MEKRGELTSSQIVALVLTIFGFIIVLVFLLVYLDAETYGNDEACRLSVITRATAPSEAERLVPLKCTTEKICLRINNKDSCPQFIGEKNVVPIDLPSEKNAAARKIEQVSADALYNCWKMMGEGKLDLFGGQEGNPVANFALEQFTTSEIKPKCVICSRVALSEELKKRQDILSQVNVNRYMAEAGPAGSQLTYLKLLTDEQIGNYPINFTKNVTGSNGTQTDELAFIFMQILANKDPIEEAVKNGVNTGVAIGGGLLLTPTGKVTSLIGTKFAVIGTIVAAAASGGISYYQASVNQGLAATTCGKFGSVKEERYGCSIFTPTDYKNITNINILCNGGIEGNP
jgi:hypothetical protein